MAGRSVRNKRIAKRNVTLIVIAALLLTAVLSVQIFRVWRANRVLDRNIEALEQNLTQALEENEALEEKRSHPLSEDDMIRIAREKFGMLFPNEIMFVPEN